MASFLVTYGTGEGQTAKVGERIASAIEARGHDATTHDDSEEATVHVGDFDAVLVGSPVHNRRHRPEVVEFVERNRETLEARPSAFFQLSLASLLPYGWAEVGDRAYAESLADETGWQPDRVGLFAGAVRYSQYDRPTRWIFRLVSALTTGDTDASRDYEYTDWDEVEEFADDFAAFAESRIGEPSPWQRVRQSVDRRRAATLGLVGVGLAGLAYWTLGRRQGPSPGVERAPAAPDSAGTEVPIEE